MNNDLFKYSFLAASGLDIGRSRKSNQDEVLFCPEIGFFGVSDGMGGMPKGGETSRRIKKELPLMVKKITEDFRGGNANVVHELAEALKDLIITYNDRLFGELNIGGKYLCGATLSCVMLAGSTAIFINLGDSRGFILNNLDHSLRQITEDHNVAAELVRIGALTREQAKNHYSSSQLVQYMGMDPPAKPDCFMEEISPGDSILLCSDGLYGMLSDAELAILLRSSNDPNTVCKRLVDAANKAGGRDNISAVYITIDQIRDAQDGN